jgi:hypothetical protein
MQFGKQIRILIIKTNQICIQLAKKKKVNLAFDTITGLRPLLPRLLSSTDLDENVHDCHGAGL